MSRPTRLEVLRAAWPLILANASSPLLGLVDTAVLGNAGTTAELGAVALGALVLNFVYWSFGFLRMGTTGFVAQAAGAGDEGEVRAGLVRSLVVGGLLGVLLTALQVPIVEASMALLDGGPLVEGGASEYVRVRLFGAPAALAVYALLGTLVGLGATRRLLLVQLFMNGLNIGLDVLFAGHLGMGATGVALGTAISEWVSLVLAAWLVVGLLRRRAPDLSGIDWDRVRDLARLRETLLAHGDILVRTLALLAGFAWFTNRGARFGDATLAANHVLLQLVSLSAFFLDGFAFVTESYVGRAKGARDLALFDRAVRRCTEPAVVSAVVLAALVLLVGPAAVEVLTDLPDVRSIAGDHLGQVAVYVLVSVAAFQLDGVFIGATRSAAMRNASVVALLGFLGLDVVLAGGGNSGLWWAFVGYVVLRAVALAVPFPALRRAVAGE